MNRSLSRRTLLGVGATLAVGATAFVAPAAAHAASPDFLGTVVSPSGAPVPNVFVSSEAVDSIGGNTDAHGRFDFANPFTDPTEHVYLCARLTQDSPLGGVGGWSWACGYAEPGVPTTLRFVQGAAIGGTVTDVRTGRPLAGATVGVWDTNESYEYAVTTDTQGRWRYRNLPTGAYSLVPYRAQKVTSAAPFGYLPVGDAPDPIVLRPGQLRTIDIQVAPAVEYTGTVVDAGGAPVTGARVAVATYEQFITTPVGADGTWTALAPWSGVADVCTWAGASTAHPTGLAVACRVITSTGTTVRPTLRLAATGGALAGTVTGAGGSGAVVDGLVPLSTGAVLPVPAVRQGSTYTVAGLPRGSFQVRAASGTTSREAVGYSPARVVRPGVTSTFPTITLTAGS